MLLEKWQGGLCSLSPFLPPTPMKISRNQLSCVSWFFLENIALLGTYSHCILGRERMGVSFYRNQN